MHRFFIALLGFALLLPAASTAELAATPCTIAADGTQCCKRCSKGKPCGDSCIAKNKTCTKGKGCTCQG